jgi:hypothetical protein
MYTLQIKDTKKLTKIGKPLFEVVHMLDGKKCPPVAVTPPNDALFETNDKTLLENLKWYLEEYLDSPIDPYHLRAYKTQDTLRKWGHECFNTLFTGDAKIWYTLARQSGLKNLKLEIVCDNPVILAWPWEVLYSEDDEFIALKCCIERQLHNVSNIRSFATPLPNKQLNILYIVARPYSENDIDFQTLAQPLINIVWKNN